MSYEESPRNRVSQAFKVMIREVRTVVPIFAARVERHLRERFDFGKVRFKSLAHQPSGLL